MAIGGIVRSQLPAALGLGRADGALEKLMISYEKGGADKFKGEIVALFNPNEITITKAVNWEPKAVAAPGLGYVLEPQGDSYLPPTLELDLFFDTYEQSLMGPMKKAPPAVLGLFPGATPSRTSVAKYTEEVAQLIRIDQELHRPPICVLTWGKFQLFKGVLTNLTQKFTLFQPDGTPVRATLTCSFAQYQSAQEAMWQLDLHSADVPKMHTVRRGDTLSSIAAEAYNDPGLWRPIAQANDIQNPRALAPGQVLRIPTLKP